MAYKNLREFMARLEYEGEMKRIQADADVDLEITEITDRVSKSGGPALFFESPRSAKDGEPDMLNVRESACRRICAACASFRFSGVC